MAQSEYVPRDTKTKEQSRYRTFHPSDILHLRNPFNEEIVWQVTDDQGNPLVYKIGPNALAELPGGLVATLGLKTIIDKMIQEDNGGKDYLNIYNPEVRQKYEEQIIVKYKAAPVSQARNAAGEQEQVVVDLTSSDDAPKPEKRAKAPEVAVKPARVAFPTVNKDADDFAAASAKEAAEMAKAGLGKTQVIEE